MHYAFLVVSGVILAAGIVWVMGAKYLAADTATAEAASDKPLPA
jgi:hypothetical protein